MVPRNRTICRPSTIRSATCCHQTPGSVDPTEPSSKTFPSRFQNGGRTFGTHGRPISHATVERHLRDHGSTARRPFRGPILTARNRQNHLTWAHMGQRTLVVGPSEMGFTNRTPVGYSWTMCGREGPHQPRPTCTVPSGKNGIQFHKIRSEH